MGREKIGKESMVIFRTEIKNEYSLQLTETHSYIHISLFFFLKNGNTSNRNSSF